MSRIVTPTGTRRLAGGEESDAAIHATGELATALAHIHRDTLLGSELARIADTFDRAPHQVVPNRMGPSPASYAPAPANSAWLQT